MGRRQQRTVLDELFDALKHVPVWVGPLLAVVVFVVIRVIAPHLFVKQPSGVDLSKVVEPLLPVLSWVASGVVVVIWLAAEAHKLGNRRLLDSQSGIESVRSLSWSQFEHLVAEAYRRTGYVAEVVGNAGGDGGVDIVLSGRGERVLVQCKQWRAYTVGVRPVRELLGVVTSNEATRGIVITSGRFTREAHRFAQATAQIALVEGQAVAEMIREVQGRTPTHHNSEALGRFVADAIPSCPICGQRMVRRTAKRGRRSGTHFWGCSSFPRCRGLIPA